MPANFCTRSKTFWLLCLCASSSYRKILSIPAQVGIVKGIVGKIPRPPFQYQINFLSETLLFRGGKVETTGSALVMVQLNMRQNNIVKPSCQ